MRALGLEVIEAPTALLSNHPHYPTMRGRMLDAGLVSDLLTGIKERGLHAHAATILSGFLGSAGKAAAVARVVDRAKATDPGIIYACDPVMGDSDIGFFADPDLRAAFARDLVPRADVLSPDASELTALASTPVVEPTDVTAARVQLGIPVLIATSVTLPGEVDRIAAVVA